MLGPLVHTLSRRRDRDGSASASALLIDRHLPEYDVTRHRHAVVDADPETTYEAALEADIADADPVVRALDAFRDLPARVDRRLRGTEATEFADGVAIARLGEIDEWALLDERPGEEVVFGTVGAFRRPSIEWREIDPDVFAAVDEPGYAKLAASLSVRPYGEGRTLLTAEVRAATTDDESGRRLRRYWRLIGPSVGYLMGRTLERVRADAESLADGRATRSQPDGESRRRWRWFIAALAGVVAARGALESPF